VGVRSWSAQDGVLACFPGIRGEQYKHLVLSMLLFHWNRLIAQHDPLTRAPVIVEAKVCES